MYVPLRRSSRLKTTLFLYGPPTQVCRFHVPLRGNPRLKTTFSFRDTPTQACRFHMPLRGNPRLQKEFLLRMIITERTPNKLIMARRHRTPKCRTFVLLQGFILAGWILCKCVTLPTLCRKVRSKYGIGVHICGVGRANPPHKRQEGGSRG